MNTSSLSNQLKKTYTKLSFIRPRRTHKLNHYSNNTTNNNNVKKYLYYKPAKGGKTMKNQKNTSKNTFEQERRIIVSYGSISNKVFPNYKMEKFPKTWVYDGYEGALNSQPKWQTNNAYYFGPKKDIKKAKESIAKLYDKYQKKKYISKYKIIVK